MTQDILLSEIQRIQESMETYSADRGTYFSVCLQRQIQGLRADQVCRVFQVRYESGGYCAFYALLNQDRATVYKSEPAPEPQTERGEIWLILEHLLLGGKPLS
jgi:hypothetical protein